MFGYKLHFKSISLFVHTRPSKILLLSKKIKFQIRESGFFDLLQFFTYFWSGEEVKKSRRKLGHFVLVNRGKPVFLLSLERQHGVSTEPFADFDKLNLVKFAYGGLV